MNIIHEAPFIINPFRWMLSFLDVNHTYAKLTSSARYPEQAEFLTNRPYKVSACN